MFFFIYTIRVGLYLNNDVVVEDKWTVERIKNRTDKLVSISLNLFKL